MLKVGQVPIVAALSLLAAVAFAHPGRTDSSGGHNDRKHGGYHYHGGGGPSNPESPTAGYKPPKMTALLKINESLAKSDARETARTQPRTSPPTLRTSQARTQRTEKLGSDFQLNPEAEAEKPIEPQKVEVFADPKDEARASKLLDFTKRQRATGNADVATRWARRIVVDYSNTSSATEAKMLLDEWKASEPYRTWKDVTGKFNVKAKFLRLDAGSVYLHTQAGKYIAVEIKKLCRNDQEYILNREGLH